MKDGDLLVLFWSGHGILDQRLHRRLFCADAGIAKYNIDVDDLLAALSGDHFCGLGQQVIFVDACANRLKEMRLDLQPPESGFALGNPRPVSRDGLLAAAQGERAVLDREKGFGFVVADWLDRHARTLPPPMAELTAHVLQHFTQLRTDRVTEQHPVRIREILHGTEHSFGGDLPTVPRDGIHGFSPRTYPKGAVEQSTTETMRASYIAQVHAIAPKKLVNRDAELDALAAFCSGEDSYQWWQGPPWAGKTALTAWFVLHPPRGTQIASFFITGRLDAQADSDGFTLAMCQQFAMLASVPAPRDISRIAQKEIFAYLLEAAARRTRDSGERLILVVDGLDEDRAVRPGSHLMSIASLLPPRLPDGVRVLVTSREHPPLADDLPSNHPLRTCSRRTLRVYAEAHGMAASARQEMRQRLQGDDQDRDIITLITAAGGGLTAAELAELTGRPVLEIENQLDSVFGRSLRCWPLYGTTENIYLFAHDTLRASAEKMLSADLRHCRVRFHDWAERYRALGWPDATPRYLFQAYARMLSATRDKENLAALAAEKARHDRMLKITDSDTESLAEIAAAQDIIVHDTVLDLTSLVLIAAEKRRLSGRNENVPEELPVVWARLGKAAYAADLARSIPDEDGRFCALAKVATEISLSDHLQAAELVKEAEHALNPVYDSISANTLAHIAKAMSVAGEWRRAEVIARSIYNDAISRARALAEVAAAIVVSDPQIAKRIASDADRTAHAMSHAPYRAYALAEVASALAASHPSRARRLASEAEGVARKLTPPHYQAEELARIAEILAVGHPARATRLAREAENLARSIADWFDKERPLAAAARALAAVGLYERAEDAAHELYDPEDEDYALAKVAASLAAAGLRDRAEHMTNGITSSSWHRANALTAVAGALIKNYPENAARIANEALRAAWSDDRSHDEDLLLARVAEALAAAGRLDRAETTAANITDSSLRAKALSCMATAFPDRNPEDTDRIARSALFVVRDITHPTTFELTLNDIVKNFATAKMYGHAEEAARDFENPSSRATALANIAIAAANDNPKDSARIAVEAHRMVRDIDRPMAREYTLLIVIEALSAASLLSEAQHAARAINESQNQARAAVMIVKAIAASGLFGQAEDMARTIVEPLYQAHALSVVAVAVASVSRGDASRIARCAWQMARDHANDESLGDTIIEIVEELAAAGQWNSAEDIIRSMASDYARQKALVALIEALVRVGRWRQAKALLNEIMSEMWKTEALKRICTVILDAKSLNQTKIDDETSALPWFLSQILVSKGWDGALVSLGRMAPSSVIALCDWINSGAIYER